MPIKPYSFRYPFDVQTAMRAWEKHFAQGLGTSDDYWNVMRYLADRDRAIEDYLSLGIGQGYLGIKFMPVGNQALTGVMVDLANLSVNISVPANRRILVMTHVRVIATSAAPVASDIRTLDETNQVITSDYYFHGSSGTAASVNTYNLISVYVPTPGPHTIRTQGRCLTGSASTESIANDVGGTSSFLSVEDIGPIDR